MAAGKARMGEKDIKMKRKIPINSNYRTNHIESNLFASTNTENKT